MKKIVIVGGGFAGLWAAIAAARESLEHASNIEIALVSSDRYLTIRPRLYEQNPHLMRVPLDQTLDPIDVTLVEGVVHGIDINTKSIQLAVADGKTESLHYDRLILTAGSIHKKLPFAQSTENIWNIDSYAAAVALDEHLRRIVKSPDAPGHNTIVIVGGGFTGIELATEMRLRLAAHSDKATAAKFRVVLIEQSPLIGPELGANPRPMIEQALAAANVEVLTNTRITEIEKDGLRLTDGTHIDTCTIVITAGLQANPLAKELPVEPDELGRLPVDDALRVRDVPDVFAAGDIAKAHVDDDKFAMMSCQHAMPMGMSAGHNAVRDLLGLPLSPYRQPDYVTCLDLGPAGALYTTGWDRQVKLSGEEGKQRKQKINCQWIYPPGGEKDAILAAADTNKNANRRKAV